jgi:Peptidase A4 family
MSDGRSYGKGEVSDTVIADLERRFTGFAVPEGTFDPSTATADQLMKFGLPPKPDPECQPLLRRAWDIGFGKPLRLQAFEVERDLVEQSEYRLFEKNVAKVSFEGNNFEISSNWSGAYITANQDRHFLQIWGIWTIPDNLRMPPPHLQGPAGIPYVCANWIGLDGQRLYLDSSLPQMGTVSVLQSDNTTTAQAWTQWWARDSVDPAPVPLAFSVTPGDRILSVLTASDPTTVNCIMVNLTPSPPTAIVAQAIAPTVVLRGGTNVQPSIAGATAEWIVERPRVPNPQPGQPPTAYNFADYGQTEFELCLAVEGDSVDTASLFAGLPQELQGARRIRMFDVLVNPARTEFISMPRKLSDTSIRVKYGSF